MRALAALIAPICASLLSVAVQACEGRTTILDETFVSPTKGWQTYPNVSIGDGKLTITLSDHHVRTWLLNTGVELQDADICVTGSFPDAAFQGLAAMGVVFWSADDETLVLAKLGSDGVTGLLKREGEFRPLWSQPAPAFNAGAGATNTIRVVTRGNLISVYVNGARIRDAEATHPTRATHFGLFVEAAQADASRAARTFSFRAVLVTSVDQPN